MKKKQEEMITYVLIGVTMAVLIFSIAQFVTAAGVGSVAVPAATAMVGGC